MAKIKISELADAAAALLGETLARECRPADSPFPDIEERTRLLAPGLLANLITEAPLERLSGYKNFDNPVEIANTGEATLRLPDDFLRLVSIRMSDWSCDITEPTPASGDILKRQKSRWTGVRGNPERPVAIISFSDSGRCLKLYSSKPGAVLGWGYYMAMPSVAADDSLEVPPSLYSPLLQRLTEELRKNPC